MSVVIDDYYFYIVSVKKFDLKFRITHVSDAGTKIFSNHYIQLQGVLVITIYKDLRCPCTTCSSIRDSVLVGS